MRINNAIWYLILTKIKGQIRNFFNNPIKLLLTVLVIVITVFSFINAYNNPVTQSFKLDVLLLNSLGGLFLFLMLFIMMFNKNTALVYANDGNYIFAGPFSKKDITLYIIVTTYIQSIMIAIGFVIYIMIFFNSTIHGFSHVLGLILSVFLHFTLLTLYYTYLYIKEAAKDEPKHVNRTLLFIILIIMIGMVFYIVYPNFTLDSIKQMSLHPLFNFIPFIGSFSWIANMFTLKDVSGLIPVSILVLLTLYCVYLILNFKGNFIEKSISDAEFLSSKLKKVKEGNYEAVNNDVNLDKVRKRKYASSFMSGGLAILSKQFLVLRKTRKLIPMSMVLFLVLYGVMALFMQDVPFFMSMIVFSLFIGSDNSLLTEELKKPYIYLIPDSNFKKLLSAITIPFVRVFILQTINLILLLILKVPLAQAIMFYLFVLSCYLVILMVDCLSIRILKSSKNIILQAYLKMFLYLVALIPTGALVIVTLYFDPDMSLSSLFGIAAVMNVLLSCVGLFFAQDILDGNNLAS